MRLEVTGQGARPRPGRLRQGRGSSQEGLSRVGRAAGKRPDRNGREARIDPVCHTLVGAALSRSGLGKRTALGASALIIGANLPDIDVLAYFGGPGADLEWRRGWTHGVLALLVLPWLLAGCLLVLHRVRGRQWSRSLAVPRELLFLSYVAILSHPVLDTLNTYGVRWLMPFSGEWFYGDTLFIIDPWVWLALALGLYFSSGRRRAPTRQDQQSSCDVTRAGGSVCGRNGDVGMGGQEDRGR